MPVGLFGRGQRTRCRAALGDRRDGHGRRRARSRRRARRRHPLGARAGGDDRVHRVRRLEAQRACGPGPPNACSSCCSTSFDPLAAQRFSVASPTPVPGQVGGERRAQRGERRGRGSGSGRGGLAARRGDVATSAGGGGYGFSLVFSRTGTSSCGAPYGLRPRRSSRSGRSPRVTPARSVLTTRLPPVKRAVTASPCAGRSSASASATTWRPTSRSASRGVLDDVDAAQEGLHRQAAGVPGAAAGGQHVVGPGAVVAERDRRVRADEDGAGVAHPGGDRRARPRSGSPGARRRRRRRRAGRRPRRRRGRRPTAGRASAVVMRSVCLVAATWRSAPRRRRRPAPRESVTSTDAAAGRARPG